MPDLDFEIYLRLTQLLRGEITDLSELFKYLKQVHDDNMIDMINPPTLALLIYTQYSMLQHLDILPLYSDIVTAIITYHTSRLIDGKHLTISKENDYNPMFDLD